MHRQIELFMEHHRPSGRWQIKTAGPKTKTQFPAEDEIARLWEAHVSGGTLSLGNELGGRVFAFYVEVSSGSTKAQRAAFLNALAALCR